ncbi:hypothetical protein PR202_gb12399 [Eleusine coracana subsp. coracana]|uniref:Protein kinase domain-containing protein n=1 Tax=Eleusine coracana subsp. coracana TaxID=191504 RepID=A0AAV5ERA2_ELECO|nr:hypothetical protein PR202_gb12399 [Eleusine coracana subsp. coracana]
MDVRRRSMPVWLDWAIRDGNEAHIVRAAMATAENRTGYACVSANSECVDAVNGPGYYCRCKQGFEGNPYLEKNGCTKGRTNFSKRTAVRFSASTAGKPQDFHQRGAQENHKEQFSHVLGKGGGSGHVYKGILEDGTMVAVKTAIEFDEARKEDFTNEVIIQSQMIHKNIIKLLGCCLEVDVPMLVYEFAPKGNLYDILHGNKANRHQQLHLPLDLRLDIAAASAEGLKYMHSSTNNTIRHGDVKGEDFTALVVGSMGYIDPVFSQTGLLTQKSDVYSFGVVLLELICRKPTIYNEHCSLVIEFRRAHERNGSGMAMIDEDIAVTEEDVFVMEEMGRLAIECLEEEVEDRPEMKEVAERLVMLRRARNHGQRNYGSPAHYCQKNNVGGALGTDVSRTTSSTTVPLIPAMRQEFPNL